MEDLSGVSSMLISQLRGNMTSLKEYVESKGFRRIKDPLSVNFTATEENCPYYHYSREQSPVREEREEMKEPGHITSYSSHVKMEESQLWMIFERIQKSQGAVTLEILLEELHTNKQLQDLVGIRFETRLIKTEIESLFSVGKKTLLSIEDFQTFVNSVSDYAMHRNVPKQKQPSFLEELFDTWSEDQMYIEKSRLLALFQMNSEILRNYLAGQNDPKSVEDINERIMDALEYQFTKIEFLRFFDIYPGIQEIEEEEEEIFIMRNPPKASPQPKPQKKKTVPQPFNLSVSKGGSIREQKVKEMISQREELEMREVKKKFKANPIPRDIYKEKPEGKKKEVIVEEVEIQKKPARSKSVKKYQNDFHIPPPIISYSTKNVPKIIEEEKKPAFHARDVPDFKKLQDTFKKQLQVKKRNFSQTVPQPFRLSESAKPRDNEYNPTRLSVAIRHDVNSILETFELTTKQRDIFKQNYEKLNKKFEEENKALAKQLSGQQKKFYVRTKKSVRKQKKAESASEELF